MSPLQRFAAFAVLLLPAAAWPLTTDIEGRWLSGDGDGWIEITLVGDSLVGRLLVLQASIERQAGNYPRAEELFRQAFQLFPPTDSLDAALCGGELARVLLQQSKSSEAYDTAKAMLPLIEPLEKNPVASAALAELFRCALAGQGMSLELLRRVARGLEEGRTGPGGRVLPFTAAAGRRTEPPPRDRPAGRAPRGPAPVRGSAASAPCRGRR